MGKDRIGILELIPILLLIAAAAFLPVALIFGPGLIDRLKASGLPDVHLPANPPGTGQQNATMQSPASPGFKRYFALKNASCSTLSKDFLIQTQDVSAGSVQGLDGREKAVAESMLSPFLINQSTRVYVKGQEMKTVLRLDGVDHTAIFKDGREYRCETNCTMHLLGDAGWQSFLDSLSAMRTDCAYFGKTAMPGAVDMGRLLSITDNGAKDMNGYTCEDFLIWGNASYAQSLVSSNLAMSDDQRALLWSLSHMRGPAEECLDGATGLIVYRNITLDLTRSYRFGYSPGGYMLLNQQTTLGYYTGAVPESFLALPG